MRAGGGALGALGCVEVCQCVCWIVLPPNAGVCGCLGVLRYVMAVASLGALGCVIGVIGAGLFRCSPA
eukprot:2319205-Pyramimonas_sp.AAC.1